MDRLLKWAVINSSTEKEDPTKSSTPHRTLTDLDPGVIDIILGKDDATLMREMMDQLEDKQVSLEDKEVLMENFEMLVGHIDNALNMEPLQLWPRLLALIQSDEAPLRSGALWIAGTCIQNNPKAKVVFIKENGLHYALDRLEKDMVTSVRVKALYCLSSLLQNAPPTIELFTAKNGYTIMLNLLQNDKDTALHARTLFLLHQLALQCPEEHIPQMHQKPFANAIANLVTNQQDNEDIVEKGLHALIETYINPIEMINSMTTSSGRQTNSIADVSPAIKKLQPIYSTLHSNYGNFILSSEEWSRLQQWLTQSKE